MPPLSKEEMKARKEAITLENIRVEEEAHKQAKRNELQREINAQASKRRVLDQKWREMMLKVKTPEFKQDIEVMWHAFDRTYDKKTHLANYTVQLMNIAESQFQRSVSYFCDTVDTTINKLLLDLEDMSKNNVTRTVASLGRGEIEASLITTNKDAAETHLHLLIYHSHSTADNVAWTTRGENFVRADEEKTKFLKDREHFISLKEDVYNSIWEQYKSVLKAYVIGTAENQKKVRKLRKKENLMADIIAAQSKKLANSDNLLNNLRTELLCYESGSKQTVFRERRNRYRAACYKMKKNMIDECEYDSQQLSKLVLASTQALDWLEAAHKKAEDILQLAGLCRKYETLREKVLPHGTTIPHSPLSTKVNVRKQTSSSEESLVTNAVSSTCGLTRLWQRMAKAELSRRALLKEKNLLEQENELILKQIEQYKTMPQHNMTVEKKCLCNRLKINTCNDHPNAIEGTIEVNKLNFL